MSNNYSGKLNLLKFLNACIVTVKGNTSTKRGVFIPSWSLYRLHRL